MTQNEQTNLLTRPLTDEERAIFIPQICGSDYEVFIEKESDEQMVYIVDGEVLDAAIVFNNLQSIIDWRVNEAVCIAEQDGAEGVRRKLRHILDVPSNRDI